MNLVRTSWAENLVVNSKPIAIVPNERYRVTCKIVGIEGKPFSACFGVLVLNSKGTEIARFGRWINNFDNLEHDYEVIFTAPSQANSAVFGYRINRETKKVSSIELELPEIESIQLEKFAGNQANSFDNISDHGIDELRPLTEQQEDDLERNIIWIFGSSRSGTTWLGAELLSHPSIEYWHEPYIGWHLSQFASWFGITHYFFSHRHKKNWIPALRKLILMRSYSQASSLDMKVLIKEPNGSAAAGTIMECLPNSKMIFLLRDGRDVIDSSIDSYRPGSWKNATPVNKVNPLSDETARREAIRVHALEWKENVEATKKAFDKHNPDLRILVRYESLRKDTRSELEKIYKFIGIDMTSERIAQIVEKYDFDNLPESKKGPGKFNRLATPGAWQNNFSESEKALITSLIGPTLEQLGYQS